MHFTADIAGRRLVVEIHAEKGRYGVVIEGRRWELDVCRTGPGFMSVLVGGRSYDVRVEKMSAGYNVRLRGETIAVALSEGVTASTETRSPAGNARLTSPMPGKVVRVLVAPGDSVQAGAALVVVEAMKMENELRALRGGQVLRVHVREGQTVEGGALLLELG
jgi:biotin carboxyl carrier protein